MKINYRVASTLFLGIALSLAGIQNLHAQTKLRAYAIVEIDVSNEEAFMKEYAPIVGKIITDGGGKYISRGGKIVAIEGAAAKRITIVEFESVEKAQALFASAAYRDARKIGEKYAKFRVTAVEALPQ